MLKTVTTVGKDFELSGFKIGSLISIKQNKDKPYKVVGFLLNKGDIKRFIIVESQSNHYSTALTDFSFEDLMRKNESMVIMEKYNFVDREFNLVGEDDLFVKNKGDRDGDVEPVIGLEIAPIFNKTAIKIIHQDEEIIERGKFSDDELRVYSTVMPDYFKTEISDYLCIKGTNKHFDDRVIVVENEDVDSIIDRVRKLNKKYGAKKISKQYIPEVGEAYYTVTGDLRIQMLEFKGDNLDNKLIEIGNCYETRDKAESAKKVLEKALKECKEKYCV